MSTTLYETTVHYTSGRVEKLMHGWSSEPKNGVLHLYDVEGGRDSRTLVLANVQSYETRRLR